jgi:iron(III) transport system substrate-binding protein
LDIRGHHDRSPAHTTDCFRGRRGHHRTARRRTGVVNVYTNREPGLYSATLDEFTKATGIQVKAIFSEQGLAERMRAEGENSPADVLITVDIGRLQEAVGLGLAQPLRSEVLAANIPAQFRDPEGRWFALSLRARAVYAAKDRVPQSVIAYEELADPKWKGKICTRSFQHQYNVALTAAFLVKHGEARTEEWLRGVKANLARKPSGGDRDVAKDISAGVCDIGLGNQYYVGLMTNGSPRAEALGRGRQGDPPDLPGRRNPHQRVRNCSGETRAEPRQRDQADGVLDLDGRPAGFCRRQFRIPGPRRGPDQPVGSFFGELKADPMAVGEIAAARSKASELVDKVAFDR